jgi:predicted DNA-binding protein (UPF0251 family)
MDALDTHIGVLGHGNCAVINGRFEIIHGHWIDTEVVARIAGRIRREGSCWIVSGFANAHGHVKIENHARPIYVHRAVFAWLNGPIPEKAVICHRCDDGRCVNPEHLFLGTQADNVADMLSKHRGSAPPVRKGEANVKVTLTDAGVVELRLLAATGKFSQRNLARRFGVSQSTVWRILRGQTRTEEGRL